MNQRMRMALDSAQDRAHTQHFLSLHKLTPKVEKKMWRLNPVQRSRVLAYKMDNLEGDKNEWVLKAIRDAKASDGVKAERENEKLTYHFNNVTFDGVVGTKPHYEVFVEELVAKFQQKQIGVELMKHIKVSMAVHKNLSPVDMADDEQKKMAWNVWCMDYLKQWRAHITVEVHGADAVKQFKEKVKPKTLEVCGVTAKVFKADRATWGDHLASTINEVVVKYATNQSVEEVKNAGNDSIRLAKQVQDLSAKLEKLQPQVLEGSLELDGHGAYMELFGIKSFHKNFTWMAWLRPHPDVLAPRGESYYIFHRKNQIRLCVKSGELQLWICDVSRGWGKRPVASCKWLEEFGHKWCHVAVSFGVQSGERKADIFIDGKLGPAMSRGDCNVTIKEQTPNATETIWIGAGPDKDDTLTTGGSPNCFFKGCITEVCLYGEALDEKRLAKFDKTSVWSFNDRLRMEGEQDDPRKEPEKLFGYAALRGKNTPDIDLGRVKRLSAGMGASYWSSESPWDITNITRNEKYLMDLQKEMERYEFQEVEQEKLINIYKDQMEATNKDGTQNSSETIVYFESMEALDADIARRAYEALPGVRLIEPDYPTA